jgi:hypothetical protein
VLPINGQLIERRGIFLPGIKGLMSGFSYPLIESLLQVQMTTFLARSFSTGKAWGRV